MTDNLIVLPGVVLPGAAHNSEPGAAANDPLNRESDGGPPPPELLIPALEACLFAMPGVITLAQLATSLQLDTVAVRGGLEALRERLVRTGSGLRLVEVGDGWQLRTEPRLASWVAAIRGGRPFRLTRAALETLSVIAFRQPVSKTVIDEIRGVDSGAVIRMLLERGLVRSMGRAEEPGRPLTWGTTPQFLHTFGLRSLADLPTLRDLRALQADDPRESAVDPGDDPGEPAEETHRHPPGELRLVPDPTDEPG